jgi:hypothetical protein
MIISRGEFWKELLSQIEIERGMAIENNATGSATDWSDYRERVGYIRALGDVTGWIEEMMQQGKGD